MTRPAPSSKVLASTRRADHRLRESRLKRKALGVAAFLILAASALNALFGDRGLLSLLEAREQYRELVREVELLEAENRRLMEEIHALRTDPLVVERLAREILGMTRPGEVAVIIREPDSPR